MKYSQKAVAKRFFVIMKGRMLEIKGEKFDEIHNSWSR
ncbi:hypothetical protein CGSSp4595_0710 [Streptococcus pneumoniae 459-5]|uniref:Uncharacterized protein n=2 Tax=Streptococcus pneumoniae TaxID=1313 RepID=B1IAW8_STRPI|nr:hypothetical protein SPH_0892 [Streptococcus pneumoniae Hungary19A-6]ACO19251.1 hypothetical protein SPJ_0734 [Streptococcus pneumoniae JJA]ANO36651.1 hypothetical protein SPND219_02303 [Streptococcus pneumoniae]EDT50359.1 hypothetical protein SP187300_0868 [Streptococcus pneumoniae CDC1873-00]EDT97385.1 hypothetical protein SP305906_0777 [Streptococcus pneumoniae CDC3059-06]EFL68084.1 hypothetical protein CGSSp14BS292_09010 [Streptococcus pneumoniae SP14-BS292]EFL69045.1 hypothetical prot